MQDQCQAACPHSHFQQKATGASQAPMTKDTNVLTDVPVLHMAFQNSSLLKDDNISYAYFQRLE